MNTQYENIFNQQNDESVAYIILGSGFVGSTLWKHLSNGDRFRTMVSINRDTIHHDLPIKNPTYIAMEFTDKLRYVLEGHFNTFRQEGFKKIVIVNALAFTDTSPSASFGEAFAANMVVPGVIARVVKQQRFYKTEFRIVHISTSCLYDDSRSDAVDGFFYVRKEDDVITEPTSHHPYYFTKLSGEYMYGEVRQQTIIVRPRLIYGNSNHKSNLLNKVAKYDCVVDCPQSMTHIDTLCAAIMHLARHNENGIYNVVDDGYIKLSNYFPNTPSKTCNSDYKVILVSNAKLIETGFPTLDGNTIFQNCVDGLSEE